VPSEADCQRAGEVIAPTLQPGWLRLSQSTLAGLAIGAAIGLGLGLTDSPLAAMVDPPAWVEDNLAVVGLFVGAVAGAFLGALVGLARWVLLLRISWEMRSGLRSASGVQGTFPAMTAGARRLSWGLVLPIAAGIFVVATVVGTRWVRGDDAVVRVKANDPNVLVTITGRDNDVVQVLHQVPAACICPRDATASTSSRTPRTRSRCLSPKAGTSVRAAYIVSIASRRS
jgi:hypothetical protein